MLSKLAEELRIDSYVSFNGQYVVMKGEKIYTNPFSREALSDLSGFAAQSGHPLVYLDHEKMSCSAIAHPDVEQSISSLEHGLPEYDPDFYLGRDIYQTMLFCKEPEDVAYREQFPNLSFVRWHALSLDVLPAGGSKANGIAQMIGKLGFTPEEAYAFGDNLNDVEMFAYVGHSVAMGNSPDSVKQLAKYVTSDVAQDGIAQGLRMVGLL
ncbi:putative bifunctional phosphatase/peptidyl-prolyl cis-trans isomerase [compost metagenome]